MQATFELGLHLGPQVELLNSTLLVCTCPVLVPHSTGAAGPAELAVNCASTHSVRLLGELSVLTSELGWLSEKLTKSSLI